MRPVSPVRPGDVGAPGPGSTLLTTGHLESPSVLSTHRLDIGAETGAPRVLLLAPSGGLGGGVERYLGTVEERLRAGGAEVHRLDLYGPSRPRGARAQLRFAAATLRAARRFAPLDAVLTGHPSLIPVAAAAAAAGRAERAPVLFYGTDIWRTRRFGRALLARRPALYPLTISSYSAGALADVGVAPVLRPGLAAAWRATLLAAGARAARATETRQAQTQPTTVPHAALAQRQPPTLLTVFRLADADWAGKGLPELLAALPAVRRAVGPVRLLVAGRGPAPDGLRRAVGAVTDAELVESPDDAALAALYAGADLFVLCTRTRPGRSGEGYGIVLTEAQLAGCPVVGPVSGGARDAYVDGVTGATPADESPEALAAVLANLLADRAHLARMRRRAAEWARMATEPAEHTRAVFSAVLGRAPINRPTETPTTGWTAPPPRPGGTAAPEPRLAATAAPPPRRAAARVWPERADLVGTAVDRDGDDLTSDYLEASRGWSDDIEIDDLAGR
ncbi:glycosyltransferase [Pseudofrankia inefficax]|uniref:Glycosyl transferase group 1 n=1 Tax=Pseudofrankia inefficax (strain DSM 45817 / CECT 9037 / DDB 130130 / EuI1c) TaxID=298654 RepID=E3IYZ0_PSEI1|nr:glycosyl transferase group 1 [Pseudofrankia inefficax]